MRHVVPGMKSPVQYHFTKKIPENYHTPFWGWNLVQHDGIFHLLVALFASTLYCDV